MCLCFCLLRFASLVCGYIHCGFFFVAMLLLFLGDFQLWCLALVLAGRDEVVVVWWWWCTGGGDAIGGGRDLVVVVLVMHGGGGDVWWWWWCWCVVVVVVGDFFWRSTLLFRTFIVVASSCLSVHILRAEHFFLFDWCLHHRKLCRLSYLLCAGFWWADYLLRDREFASTCNLVWLTMVFLWWTKGALLIWSCSLVDRSILIQDRESVIRFKFWFWAFLVFFRRAGGWEVVEAYWSLE